jgi:hypothetical protein
MKEFAYVYILESLAPGGDSMSVLPAICLSGWPNIMLAALRTPRKDGLGASKPPSHFVTEIERLRLRSI